jgi:hypothetical protein
MTIPDSANQRNKLHPDKRDDYTADRFRWNDQVVADRELPPSAFKVAYVIATSLWRNKGTVTLVTPETTASDQIREAWIGTREIADKIGMSRFTVMTMVRRLVEQGHLEVDPGRRGRGHSNHYRLVKKGVHTSLLRDAKAKSKAKSKGTPANPSGGEKVSARTSRGAPTHQNPLYPSEKVPSKERGTPQARPGADSLRSSFSTGFTDDSDGACAPPPGNLERGFEHKSKQGRWQGKVINQDGTEFKPSPPHQQRPPPNDWMDVAFEGYRGGRS